MAISKSLRHKFKNLISRIRMKIKTSRIVSLFSQGFFVCHSCSSKYPLNPEKILEVITCNKCGCPVLQPCRIDDYLVLHPLGGGGMGSVYLCVSLFNKKIYSIKLLPRKLKADSQCVENLIKEGIINEVIGGHRNIVNMIKAGIDRDERFLVNEFIRGERLDSFIESRAPLSLKDAINIILQLVDAELHIFSKGYCYRDLKPENIIIQDNGTVKLFDFGLTISAKDAAHPDLSNPIIEGSPYYLPPERLMGEPEGEYSEIYSLGMLLFYFLSGRHYYTEKEAGALARKHIYGLRVGSTSKQISNCRPIMIKVIDKMIQRYPNHRIQKLADLKEILQIINK